MVARGTAREVQPGFIELLDRLQKKVLHSEVCLSAVGEQSRVAVRRNQRQEVALGRRAVKLKVLNKSSLKKLALQAYDLSSQSSAEELFVLLAYWSIGQTKIEKDIILRIDPANLDKTQARLQRFKRRHRVQKV
jgi:predicted O-linked N-acetylglucosamine transferase (SPINDLY family)